MTVASIADVALARNERAPRKGDVKRAPAEPLAAAGPWEVFFALIPVDAAVVYTISVTFILGFFLKDSTMTNPTPSKYLLLRWILLGASAVMLVPSAIQTRYWRLSRGQQPPRKVPAKEIITAIGAFSAWALSTSDSPLVAVLHGYARGWVAVLILFLGAGFTLGTVQFFERKP